MEKVGMRILMEKNVSHIRVDYVLRGLQIPVKHTIEFKFEPQVVKNWKHHNVN
jgi:hypothetical protein